MIIGGIMESVNNKQKIITLCYIGTLMIFSLVCFIQNPTYVVAHLFGIIYLVVAYKLYRDDFEKIQMSALLIFAILNSNAYIQVGTSIIYMYYIVVLIFGLSIIWKIFCNFKEKRRFEVLTIVQVVIIAIIGLYMIYSAITSGQRSISMLKVKNHIISFGTFIVAFIQLKKCDNQKEMVRFLKYLFLGVALLGVVEILGFKFGMRSHFLDSGITPQKYPHVAHVPFTFFYNPNNYSVFLVIIMVIITSDIIYKKIDYKDIILYLLGMINIIFAMSRTAWISLLFSLGFAIIFFIISREGKYFKRTVLLMVLTVLIYKGGSLIPAMSPFYGKMDELKTITSDTIFDNENGTAPKVGSTGSVNVRLTLITDVLEGVIKEKNYMGFGPGMTSEYVKSRGNTAGVYSLHSFLLEIMGDYGILILLLFIVVYIFQAIKILKLYLSNSKLVEKQYIFISGVWLFTLILLSFAPSTVGNFPMFWIAMAGALAMGSIDLKERV